MDKNLLMQNWQYSSSNILENIMAMMTSAIIICTLTIRFWKKPVQDDNFYKMCKLIYRLSPFKRPVLSQREKGNAG